MKVKTPNKFKQFKKYFIQYQELFGLIGYKIYFKHEPIDAAFANIIVDQEGMVVTVILNSSLPVKDKPHEDIYGTAKHEVIHLLVGRLSDYAQSRYIRKLDIQEAEEELVRRLERLIPSIKP